MCCGGGGGGGRGGRSGDTPTKFFHVREVYLPFPSLFTPPTPHPTRRRARAQQNLFLSFKFVSDRLVNLLTD